MNDYKTNESITIQKSEYKRLVKDAAFLEMLVNTLFDCVCLSWDGKRLQFAADDIVPLIRAYMPEEYAEILETLQEGRENLKDGTD